MDYYRTDESGNSLVSEPLKKNKKKNINKEIHIRDRGWLVMASFFLVLQRKTEEKEEKGEKKKKKTGEALSQNISLIMPIKKKFGDSDHDRYPNKISLRSQTIFTKLVDTLNNNDGLNKPEKIQQQFV